jgi:hypothetical protein
MKTLILANQKGKDMKKILMAILLISQCQCYGITANEYSEIVSICSNYGNQKINTTCIQAYLNANKPKKQPQKKVKKVKK